MDQTNGNDWILVAEDQDDHWTILQSSLRRTFPHLHLVRVSNVITTLSYLQACLVNQQPLPAFLLMDLYLPRREDGFHLLAALKDTSSGLTHLSVVVMSSSTDPVDQQAVRAVGAPYLIKPA